MPRQSTDSDDINRGVCARIRRARQIKMLSLQQLAASVGISYQQLQKYESGSNRIPASMIARLAAALELPVAWFFDGAANPVAPWQRAETAAMVRMFEAIDSEPLRKALLRIAAEVASQRLKKAKRAPDDLIA